MILHLLSRSGKDNMPISRHKIHSIPRYIIGVRSLLLLPSRDLYGFRVTTKFASCFVVHILKGHLQGTFPQCKARLGYRLILKAKMYHKLHSFIHKWRWFVGHAFRVLSCTIIVMTKIEAKPLAQKFC